MISNGKNGARGHSDEEYPLIGRANKMEQRAVNLGWNIPADKKQAIVDRQVRIATESDDDRHSTMAAKCLTTMNTQNVQLAISRLDDGSDQMIPIDPLDMFSRMSGSIPRKS